MEKYYIGDEVKQEKNKSFKLTLDVLNETVKKMDISAEVKSISPYRAMVTVYKDIGTTMYLATSADSFFWLKENSVKHEDFGNISKYHFVLD